MNKPERILVYPATPDMVRLGHPDGPDLPVTGRRWPVGVYTTRRLADGGITTEKPAWIIEAEAAAAAAASAPVPEAALIGAGDERA